jgi:hypothetical protein
VKPGRFETRREFRRPGPAASPGSPTCQYIAGQVRPSVVRGGRWFSSHPALPTNAIWWHATPKVPMGLLGACCQGWCPGTRASSRERGRCQAEWTAQVRASGSVQQVVLVLHRSFEGCLRKRMIKPLPCRVLAAVCVAVSSNDAAAPWRQAVTDELRTQLVRGASKAARPASAAAPANQPAITSAWSCR